MLLKLPEQKEDSVCELLILCILWELITFTHCISFICYCFIFMLLTFITEHIVKLRSNL